MRLTRIDLRIQPVTKAKILTFHLQDYGDVWAKYEQDGCLISIPTKCDLQVFFAGDALDDILGALQAQCATIERYKEKDLDDTPRLEQETREAKTLWYDAGIEDHRS